MIEAFGAKIKICMNFMGSSGLILALCLIFLFGSEATSNLPAVDFRYRTFESPEGIETLGNATFEKNVLQLTAGGLAHSIGRAVYFDPIKIWDRATGLTLSFKTAFTFSVTRPDVNHSGDGFAFGLFPHKLIPNNSGGGNLGLYDSISSTSNYGVAVEFDLFMNSFDPDNNHVGLDLNNINSACLSTLRNYGLNLGAGNEINVKIEYDGVTGRLNVYAINASLGDPGITSMVLSCQLNVSRYIVGEEVFVGFSAATSDYHEYHKIHSWTFKAWSGQSSNRGNEMLVATLAASILSMGLLLAILIYMLRKKRINIPLTPTTDDVRSNPTSDLSKEITRACDWDVFPKKFSYQDLSRATNNFDPKELLGEGGFGDVYKGTIRCGDSDRAIAVKRFSQSSSQSDREYLSEVVVIGRLRHRNLALRFLNFEAPLPALPCEKPMHYRGNGVSGFGAWEHGKIEWSEDSDSRKVGDEEERSISRSDEASTADVVSLKSLCSGGSNGIGAATARKFVAEGAYVYVVDIDEEGGVKVCQELDGNASFVKCEVTIETHVKGVVDRAMEEKGHLDIMMNNAGAMLGMKHAARVMIPRNSGSILFNCSVLGLMKTDNAFHGYMASKNALLGFDEEWCSAVGKGRNMCECYVILWDCDKDD
ncbi:hypothetical protein SUGI_1193650 [Cryptomeria japonica]|nr:hypothetical protein SUGI_1193650 [Cryptomeria japonica]